MYKYKAFRYIFTDEEFILESEDSNFVEQEVLRISSQDNMEYAYRMETWKDEKWIGGNRFFSNGFEFTQSLRKAAVSGLLEREIVNDSFIY